MPRHIEAFDNRNKPIVDSDDELLKLCYFNRVLLTKGESFEYQLPEHESAIVMVSGTCTVDVDGEVFEDVGERASIWEGRPSAVYVPVESKASIRCNSDNAEIFVAGGRYEEKLSPFVIRPDDTDKLQYGSDDTKTHRKIVHILGQNNAGKRGRLLVSELFTVGAGGWSGFPPHKHDEERPPAETRYEEVYQFRFNPDQGFGAQFAYEKDDDTGPVYHIKNGSTVMLDRGYHPCVAAPGYEMYYFTIIVGEHSNSLLQHFQPQHEHQVHTIPGIKDMISKFKQVR